MSLRSRQVALFGAVAFGLSARAEGPPRAAMLELAPLDADVPRTAQERIAAELTLASKSAFSLVPPTDLEALRSGRESPPDLAPIQAQIAKGKTEFVNFRFKEAEKTFKAARGRLISMQLNLRDYQPLIDSLLYLAVASTNTGQHKIADLMFAEVARLRPDYRVDSSQFPPVVLKNFERVQEAQAQIPRGRITVTSTVPGQVFVDEVPKGPTPQNNLAVPAGDHVIRVDVPGYVSWA